MMPSPATLPASASTTSEVHEIQQNIFLIILESRSKLDLQEFRVYSSRHYRATLQVLLCYVQMFHNIWLHRTTAPDEVDLVLADGLAPIAIATAHTMLTKGGLSCVC